MFQRTYDRREKAAAQARSGIPSTTVALAGASQYPPWSSHGQRAAYHSRPSLPPLHSILPLSISALLVSARQARQLYSPSSYPSKVDYTIMDHHAVSPKIKSRRGRKPQDPSTGALSPRTRQRNRRARVKAEKAQEEDKQGLNAEPQVSTPEAHLQAVAKGRRLQMLMQILLRQAPAPIVQRRLNPTQERQERAEKGKRLSSLRTQAVHELIISLLVHLLQSNSSCDLATAVRSCLPPSPPAPRHL
jgi:hypothetical protein